MAKNSSTPTSFRIHGEKFPHIQTPHGGKKNWTKLTRKTEQESDGAGIAVFWSRLIIFTMGNRRKARRGFQAADATVQRDAITSFSFVTGTLSQRITYSNHFSGFG